jgi:hypothetical protein
LAHAVAFEQIVSCADAPDAHTSINIALAQCNELLTTGAEGNDHQSVHTAREVPQLAPTFLGSEGFVDQSSGKRASRYQALVVIRRGR